MILSKRNFLFRWQIDRGLSIGLGILAAISAFVILLILGFLWREALPVLNNGGWRGFLWDDGWYPLEQQFGILPMVWASLAATLGAIVIAGPLGLACAIFERFFAPPFLAKPFRALLALLAGIPSVVYGLWGLTVLVPLIALWQPPGASLLAAMLILAFMILPTVAITCSSALAAVPANLLQGASALGLSERGKIIGVAIPAARAGIAGGILLAVARALGETMAVLMVAGNVVQTPSSLFDSVRVLTANIALEMAYATDHHRAGLFATGLLLTLAVLALAWSAHRIQRSAYST
jgi:phosphate transport system permease protein